MLLGSGGMSQQTDGRPTAGRGEACLAHEPTPVVASQPRMSDLPKPSAWGRRVSPVGVLAISATTVAALDLSTKQIAAFVLGTQGNVSVPLFHHAIRLTVILNDRSAFGISLGPYTWHINLVLTTVALLLCLSLCRPLAVINRWAPLMLGLIAGAATGNLVSLISSPQGVPDFIAVPTGHGQELVFNLADVAAVIGVALLIRTTGAVARALRNGP